MMYSLKNMRLRGYISSGILFIAVFGLTVSMLFVIKTDMEKSKKEIMTIRQRYLAESAARICQNLIIKGLEEKQLSVFYEYSGGDINIVDSDSIYEISPDTDFSAICSEAQELIHTESGGDSLLCEIEVTGKTTDELKLHNMDKNHVLPNIYEYSSGELSPVEYCIKVSLPNTILETEFAVSGIEFMLREMVDGLMIIKLSAENPSVETYNYNYRNR